MVLNVRSLRKTYRRNGWPRRGERLTILDGVGFNVERGEVVGLLGANGAGKTTILHAIAGLLRPDAGCVELDGRVLDAAAAREAVGLCSAADRSFYFRLSLRENLRFFAALYGLRGRRLDERVNDLLHQAGLDEFADRRYSRCSTGTRQRLSVARSLIHDPQVLLLDEPTRAIDPVHAQKLRAFVRSELAGARGKMIVLATNLLDEAWQVCDRVVLLSGGRTIAIDTPQALHRRLGKSLRYRIELEREDPFLAERISRLGSVHVRSLGHAAQLMVELPADQDVLAQLLREIVTTGARINSITADAPAAADLFALERSG